MKIKEKFYNLFKMLKNTFEKFPITIIAIIFLSLIHAINLDNDFISSTIIDNLSIFIIFFTPSTFLIETMLEGISIKKVVRYVGAAECSIILTYCMNIEEDFLGMSNEVFSFGFGRLLDCYFITVIVLAIYFNYKKSGEKFNKYVTTTFINIIKTSLICGIFASRNCYNCCNFHIFNFKWKRLYIYFKIRNITFWNILFSDNIT